MSFEPSIHKAIPRLAAELVADLTRCGVATVVEALGPVLGPQQTMDPRIKRRSTRRTVGGQAITAANGLADNMMMHAALRFALAGDVVVVACAGSPGAQWGELVTRAAIFHKLAAVVTDGSVRDIDEIHSLGFPTWAAAVRPLGARKDVPGWVNRPVNCGGVSVAPGDVIIADGDGVVVVPHALASETLRRAQARVERENATREAAASGRLPGELSGVYAHLNELKIATADEPWG